MDDTDDGWSNEVRGETFVCRDIMEKSIHNDSVGSSDEADTQDIENESNGLSSSESHDVLHYQNESVPGRSAEVFTGYSNLNVCIFTYEFDKSFQAVQKITSQT